MADGWVPHADAAPLCACLHVQIARVHWHSRPTGSSISVPSRAACAATASMEPRLPEDTAQLRAMLPKVMSLVRSRRADLLAEFAGLGGHAPATKDLAEPSAAELECEESPAALQQITR